MYLAYLYFLMYINIRNYCLMTLPPEVVREFELERD
jgi:hypothetical protein